MKRTYLLLLLLFMYWMYASAQQVQTAQEPADSVKNVAYIDSLYRELPRSHDHRRTSGSKKPNRGNWYTTFRDWSAACR